MAMAAAAPTAYPSTTSSTLSHLPLSAYQLRQDQALNVLHEKLRARGFRGVYLFLRAVRRSEYGFDLLLVNFEKILQEQQLGIRREDTIVIFNMYDSRKRGAMDVEKFVASFRTKLTEQSSDLVNAAFARFRGAGSTASAHDARTLFNAAKHPDVVAGRRLESEVLMDFLDSFDFQKEFTRLDFTRYYELVRFSHYSDADFCEMLAGVWSLSGAYRSTERSILPQPHSFDTSATSYTPQRSRYGTAELAMPPYGISGGPTSLVVTDQVKPQAQMPYDPSVRFSYASPGSIGLRTGSPGRTDAAAYASSGDAPVVVRTFDAVRCDNTLRLLRTHFNGLRNLTQLRRSLYYAARGSYQVDRQTFASVMEGYTYVSEEDCLNLWDYYIKTSDNLVSINDIVASLRLRNLNARRLTIVEQAFDKLDPAGVGSVPIKTAARCYSTSYRTGTADSKNSAAELSAGLLANIVLGDSEVITRDEFREYYADIGSGIDDDNYFVLMIWNEWSLSDMATVQRLRSARHREGF
ncbi:hypothetical protein RI367_000028 [Sorochytrium milnesiophthora]